MAYSSARATLGGKDVRKTTRQTQAPRASRTPTEIGQTVPTSAKGQRQKSAALSRVSSGSSVSRVYTSGATPSSSRSNVYTKAVKRARRQQRAERRQVQTIQRLIDREPRKVAKRVTRETSKLATRLEKRTNVQLARPKVSIAKGPKVRVSNGKLKVNPKVAKQILVGPKKPAKRAIAKKLVRIEPPQIENRQERRVAKQLKTAAKKSTPGLLKKLDRGFGPDEAITPRQTAIVAESEGLPGITYAKAIAPGESGHRPGIRNPDDNYPSLFQITPSVQSAETKSKFDAIAASRPGGYSNPIVAAKQAAVLAEGSSDAGVSNYVAFDPSAPQGHLPGGPKAARRKLYGKAKPIPKKVKTKAKRVLGEQKTKEIVKQTKQPQAPSAPKKKPGEWAGSERAVLSVIPKGVRAEGRNDKRTPEENAAVEGSPTSDHLTTNKLAYAADLPDDDALAQTIAKRLGMASHIGTNEVVKDGYRYQLIWQDAGHYDHIHLGATWVGEGIPPGTVAGGTVSSGGTPISSVTAGVTTGGTTATPTATTTKAKKDKRRKARRIEGREKSRLIRELIANTAQTSTRSETELTTTPYAERVRDRGVEISL